MLENNRLSRDQKNVTASDGAYSSAPYPMEEHSWEDCYTEAEEGG
jgi:hypothetical protein